MEHCLQKLKRNLHIIVEDQVLFVSSFEKKISVAFAGSWRRTMVVDLAILGTFTSIVYKSSD
jgi:hypothetical protein